MRKSAAEYIRELEGRIARLERTAKPSRRSLNLLKKLAVHASYKGQKINSMTQPVDFPLEIAADDMVMYGDVDILYREGLISLHSNKGDEFDKYMITPRGIEALLAECLGR